MNTPDEIRSMRQMYATQYLKEREEALHPVETKWNNLFKQIQWDCERETGHLLNEVGVCVLCGKSQAKTA